MDKNIDHILVLESEDLLLQVPLISSNSTMDSNKHKNPEILPSHHASKSPFYWGLLSQVALVVSVTTIASFLSIEHNHQLLILYPSAVVFGIGMLHILCFLIFWKKFFIQVFSEVEANDVNEGLLCDYESNNDEDGAVTTSITHLAATNRVLTAFLLVVFCLANTVSLMQGASTYTRVSYFQLFTCQLKLDFLFVNSLNMLLIGSLCHFVWIISIHPFRTQCHSDICVFWEHVFMLYGKCDLCF